jgi:hypothetical protein
MSAAYLVHLAMGRQRGKEPDAKEMALARQACDALLFPDDQLEALLQRKIGDIGALGEVACQRRKEARP